MGETPNSKHDITDEAYNDVLNGLTKAKQIAEKVFGIQYRPRDAFTVYEHLMGAIHCRHDDEDAHKEPWER